MAVAVAAHEPVPDGSGSYARASRAASAGGSVLDCALGTNPYGTSPRVRVPGSPEADHLLTPYPEGGGRLREQVVTWWRGAAELGVDSVELEAGAFGVLERAVKLFVRQGSPTLGSTPQFPDFAVDVRRVGGGFRGVPLRPERGHRFEPSDVIAALEAELALVYLDNPNNPTGQVLPLDEVEAVVAAAARLGVPVLVDEAYGEYMEQADSAVTLVGAYDNLLVARSFSKGWGLGGLRAGYVVLAPALAPRWQAVAHPFPITSLGVELAGQALQDATFPARCRERTRHDKARVLGARTRLRALHTSDAVPIMTLVHPDPDADLQRELLDRGVATTGGRSFAGLGRNAVRLRVPDRVDALVTVLEDLDAAATR